MRTIKNTQDFWAGVTFGLFGVAALWLGRSLPIGSASRMGPGYFPVMISLGLLIIGGLLLARGFVLTGPALDRGRWRSNVFITAAVIAFGTLLEPLGLVPTVAIVTGLSAAASPKSRWIDTIALAVFLCLLSIVLFIYLLGQPISLWGRS